jgi:hypothetical protein
MPTIPGLVLAGILCCSLWYTIFNNSNTERWIFILMLFMSLINLFETSYPFRLLEVKWLEADPPFSEEPAQLTFEIKNPSDVKTAILWVRLNGTDKWTEISAVEAGTSRIVSLNLTFRNPGVQAAPKIRVKTYADSGLFRYWRVIDPKTEIIVLPKPVDHKIVPSSERSVSDDFELTGLAEIRDPSRYKFTDPKIFLKTNRRYQRIFQSRQVSTQMIFRWSDLEKLSRTQKGEQFSFWLKSMAALQHKQLFDIKMEAPFTNLKSEAYLVNLSFLKSSFARWFYAQV